jgi:uncharacterized protein with PIN domain
MGQRDNQDSENCLLTINLVQAAVRIDMEGSPIASDAFDDLVKEVGIRIEPVTLEQAYLARRAHLAYGRESGSPAPLNLGARIASMLLPNPLASRSCSRATTSATPTSSRR